MPEAARVPALDHERLRQEIHDAAARLRHESRFLCRRSDRLRSHSNDLLTVAMFHRQDCRATPDARRTRLKLVR